MILAMTSFDIKTNNTFLNKNNLPTHSPSWQRLSELLALQSQVSETDGFSAFPVLRNPDAQGHIIPQYECIIIIIILQATDEKGYNYV